MPRAIAKTFSLLPVMLAFSLGANVLQAKRIFELIDPSVSRHSRVGEFVESIDVHSASGAIQTVRFDQGKPTVLYFFSPTCAWCERNWDNVEALAAASRGRFRVVAVAGEADLRSFRQSHVLPHVEILSGLSSDVQRRLSLTGTPHTLVVSAQGIVSHDWSGAFQGTSAREVEELFDITLPGLIAPVAAASAR